MPSAPELNDQQCGHLVVARLSLMAHGMPKGKRSFINMQTSWRRRLEEIQSLGSQDKGVSSLSELHEARRRHLGQFFTPLKYVKLMWQIATQFIPADAGRKIKLLDNSIGTGRLLHFAEAERHEIYGFDAHEPVVRSVQTAMDEAGFQGQVIWCGMQDASPIGMDIALINPPFSISLSSPNLDPLPCTTWGKYGKHTAAQSDEYALAQALQAASAVIALVPKSLALDVAHRGHLIAGAHAKRLRAVLHLPDNAFEDEGARVSTSILVFGTKATECLPAMDVDDENWSCPDLGITIDSSGRGVPRLRARTIDSSVPAVTQPVTGVEMVRIVHSGRKIHLKAACGYMQARVYNAVLRDFAICGKDERLPKGVVYSGQGMLDVQAHLATDDPMGSFQRLIDLVSAAGGKPVVDPGLMGFFRRLVKEKPRKEAPLGHWVYGSDHSDQVLATAKKSVPLVPSSWVSPVVKVGEKAVLRRVNDAWLLCKGGSERQFTLDEASTLFEMPVLNAGWKELHPPLQRLFPEVARSVEATARSLGIERWLDWGYQFQDLIECQMKPGGLIVSWKQGLGKARLSAALILLSKSKHGLVAMPANLCNEYANRLVAADLDPSLWKIIRGVEDLKELRKINIISYERLRMPLERKMVYGRASDDVTVGAGEDAMLINAGTHVCMVKAGERWRLVVDGCEAYLTDEEISLKFRTRWGRSYASALRNRIGVLVADEGEVLANPDSDQSRALWQVSAKRVYVTTGTPMANYPRNVHPIAACSAGDGRVGQPYGLRQPRLSRALVNSMSHSQRGLDSFRDDFCSFEWVTQEFSDTLQTGAKREIPKINNLPAYRSWVGPFIKRRLPKEPEVALHVHIPDPVKEDFVCDWDEYHLGYYLRVADEFANWFRSMSPGQRANNFMLLLARIGAVIRACDVPQAEAKHGVVWRGGLTSKQRFTVDRIRRSVDAGEKVVVFVHSPRLLEVLESGLLDVGIDSVMFHGEINSSVRERNLDRHFRYGSKQVLLATKGVMKSGWDLYQAQRYIMADREWSATAEDQAAHRLLRPQQAHVVFGEYHHLQGSISEYQAQLVSFKANSADAGLDWGTPLPDDVPFLHLDTILTRFVDALGKRDGLKGHHKREQLKALA